MRKSGSIVVLCLLALLASASVLTAQTTTPAPDPAITSLSVTGVVTELKTETRQVIVKTAAGNEITVTLSDRTTFMRIPPGEKTKDKFVPIAATDFGVGDSVFARGRMSADLKSMPALEFYVMSKTEIAQKRERERDEWTRRGIAGTVSSVNATTNEISLDTRTPAGPKPIVVAASAQTQFRRYAPDSVRFSDAKPSTFAELKVGDQLRALGTKSADGTRFTPEEIVAGSFQTIGGPITEINVEKQEIKINDLQSKQAVTVVVTKDSSLRKFTPGAGDLQEIFDRLPTFTLQELKVGDSILISSTKGADPVRITAIAIVSGVGPLLQDAQGKRAVSLGAMSLGGP
jgi:antitoxin (DNA-binding transcriptional repressor) of toxin-antitoxin stability system